MGVLTTGIALFVSHLLVDFYLQPSKWVEAKETKQLKAWQFYAHCTLAGVLAFILVGLFTNDWLIWLLPGVIIPHFLIDLWKIKSGQSVTNFFIDQGMHIAHLILIFAWLTKQNTMKQEIIIQGLIILIGALFLWMPAGIMIGKLTKKFHANLSSKDKKKALPEAGRWIGILERLFIFISILVGQFGAIGFLIAAKSILRFSDSRTVENPIRMSEYVLIGSLLSFLFAMVTALICQELIKIV